MQYLYGSKDNNAYRLAATFDSEQQLQAYVNWATLQTLGPQRGKFEQGSALAGFQYWKRASSRLDSDASDDDVPHNPTPSML